ncbi:MAG: cyclic nucleotide-binding domain-containing protein [Pseudomonadota bacterium]
MRPDDLPQIRALPLFEGMSEPGFETLVRGAYVQTFPPGVELISEGDRSDFLHVLVEGAVEMVAGWNGRETTLALLRPVATFILAATVTDLPYLMSARTLEKSRVALLPSEDVRAVFDADADFARAVVTELATGYRGMVKHAKDLKLRTGQERLANHLLRLRAERGADSFDLGMEKRLLAACLGMTPENLSRSIRALAACGVTLNGATVTLDDPGKLESLARPSPWIDDPES